MSASTTVWLIRHASPAGVEGRCWGRHDLDLSSQGLLEAKELSRRLAHEPISHIYSSGLRRALATARVMAEPHSLPVQPMEELAEIHFGDLEGLTYTEIEVRYPDLFESWMNRPEQARFPNGESFAEMRTRVLRAQDLLLARHSGEHIAVVTHAGVIRLLLCEALSIPARLMFRLAQRYASINRIEYLPNGPIVQLMNA